MKYYELSGKLESVKKCAIIIIDKRKTLKGGKQYGKLQIC